MILLVSDLLHTPPPPPPPHRTAHEVPQSPHAPPKNLPTHVVDSRRRKRSQVFLFNSWPLFLYVSVVKETSVNLLLDKMKGR